MFILITLNVTDTILQWYDVTQVESVDYEMFQDWNQVKPGVFVDGDDVVVIGESEEKCFNELAQYVDNVDIIWVKKDAGQWEKIFC